MKYILFLFLSFNFIFAEFIRDEKLEIVIDIKRDLMWQDDIEVAFNRDRWHKADFYCKDLEYSGYSDWRLPSLKELLTITDTNIYNPSINPIFKHLESNKYWSSSTDVSEDDEKYYYYINFKDGSDNLEHKSKKQYIRCVRGGKITNLNSFERKDGYYPIVTDNFTSLEWQDNFDIKIKMSWYEAKEYCENSVHYLKCDWRLPTLNELRTLVDYSKFNPAIFSEFQKISKDGYYWSITPDKLKDSYARVISFLYGEDLWAKKSSSGFVRCVREDIKY